MTKKPDQRKKRRGGFYWRDDEPFVSVTNILKIIDKPALRWWFGKEVYYAMVLDPELSEKDALSAPYRKSSDAKDRGSTVHSVVEAYTTNKKKIKTVPKKFRGYVEAFYSWVEDSNISILEQESTVINHEHRYAGTLDMIAKFENSDTPWIIDVKTGKDIYAEAGLQLSAYKHAVEEIPEGADKHNGGVVDHRMGVILLGENGTYKFAEMEDVFEAFLHAKALWEWEKKKMLENVGYLGGELP